MTRRIVVALALLALSFSPALASAQDVVEGALPAIHTMTADEIARAVQEAGLGRAPDELATADRAALRAMLAERRRAHLEELRRYVAAGEFPVNDVQPGFLNVFQDDEGHLCAVANLMRFDGEIAMVQATAQSTNYVVLRDVHQGPLHDWILSSGFTQEEIGMIQEPYFYQEELSSRQRMRMQLEEEKARLRRVLARVIRRLERSERRSIETATDRLMAARAAA